MKYTFPLCRQRHLRFAAGRFAPRIEHHQFELHALLAAVFELFENPRLAM